jgi:Retroviral aspartyl protease
MSLRFPYRLGLSPRPLVSLAGRSQRPRSIITVAVVGPMGSWPLDALIDTGADDTVFPEWIAPTIGIDLTNAPSCSAAGVGGGVGVLRFAQVRLRIADNHERREWLAWVGFTAAPMNHPMLGFAGFLQYFTATFHGDREEVELAVNSRYVGT